MRKVWRIFTAVRVAALSLVLLVCGALLYLHWIGFPHFVQQRVKNELAAKGIEARWSKLRFDLSEGVVAQDAEFYETRGQKALLAEAKRVAIHIRPLRLARGLEAVGGITIWRARVAIAEPERFFAPNGASAGGAADAPRFTAEDATVAVRFPRPGVIEVVELTGLYAGLRLNVSGQARLSPAAARPRAPGEPTMVRQILRELKSLRADPLHPPEITMRFDLDTAHLEQMRLQLHLRTRAVSYTAQTGQSLQIDSLEAEAHVHDQALELRRFRCALYGGEIVATAPGYYDLGQARMFAALRSTANLKELAPFLPPAARRALADFQFESNPTIECEVDFSEKTGVRLAARRGLAEAANFTFRAVPVRAARCRWQYAEGIFSVTDAELEMPDGRLTGSYSVNVETMDFEARLDGTFAPKTIEPLMTAKQREFLAQFEFGDAVRATNARIRGNWHFPKEIQMAGNLRLGRWTWRGESFTGLSADVRLDSEVITFSNATVKRPQGEARAEFCYDGAEGWLTVEAKGSLFPKRLVAAAFPKLRQALEPYEVEAPVVFDIRARGNTRWADSMMVEGRVEFGAATARGVGIVGGEAQFRYESGVARISHFELRRPEGAATGALVWDTRQRTVRGELVSTLNVHAMAPVFGEKFMKAIEPYQFGSPPLVWAEGIVSLSEGERTRIKLRIEGTEFTLTVPRPLAKHEGGNGQAGGAPANANGDAVAPPIRLCASKISGDLSYGQDSLTLRNVDAEFYGGKLRGSADFMFASGKVTYRGALQVERASLAQVLDAFTGKQGNVSGLLSGAAQIDDGTWGDLRTLRGQGRADILDGHLVDVPVFGLASFILNMLPGKPGNSKARTASATFVCADGLIRTEDLAVETGGTKTTMKGTVSWDGAIDFEVRTRGSNLFNVLIDPLRWLTDAHVTGTLSKPEAAPLRLK